LTPEYKAWGLTKAFPKNLLQSLTINGKVYSVPANIHRANVLWSNKAVLAKAGVTDQPTTLTAFFADLDKLKAHGVQAPLAVGKDWTQLDLLDDVLLSDLGPAKYMTMWNKGANWMAPDVTKAILDFKRLLSYSSSDRDNMDWNDAEQRLVEGKAAYQLMGDWEAGEFKTDHFTNYGYQPFPGNGNVYQWLSDSFVLPTKAADEAGAKCWLKVVGSAAGQKAFNTAKGSIPARTDANPKDYPAYQQSAIADWRHDPIVGSCSHGSSCTIGENEAATSAMGKFSSDENVQALQQALNAAVNQYGSKE
jgi:glucose/mannose transport system substrate-binding protein